MKRDTSNKNNLVCCLYQSERVNSPSVDTGSVASPTLTKPTEVTTEPQTDLHNSYTQLNSSSPSPIKTINASTSLPPQKPSESKLHKIFDNWSYYKFNFLYNTKFKYVITALFSAYMVANMFVCSYKLQINIPISDLLPTQSYLSKHMRYHLTDFELGPMIMLSFLKPITNFSNTQDFDRMQKFVSDVKQVKGVAGFELNWMTGFLQNKKDNANYFSGCELDSFSLDLVKSQANYEDDAFYRVVNETKNNLTNEVVVLDKSRVYVQLEGFTGSVSELNVMEDINYLAFEIYKYPRDELIIFSSVYLFLEQLGEIFPAIISLVAILIEGIFIVSLLYIFDLKSIIIEIFLLISLILSIFSNLYIFGITLNIVTMFQMIMLPAFLIEFLSYTMHLFLYKSQSELRLNKGAKPATKPLIYNDSTKSASISSTESYEIYATKNDEIETTPLSEAYTTEVNKTPNEQVKLKAPSIKEIRFKRLQFAFNNSINLTSLYLIFISAFSFTIMDQCSTYNFHTLSLFLLITCMNTFFHMHFFYPNLLNLFGTCWTNKRVIRLY